MAPSPSPSPVPLASSPAPSVAPSTRQATIRLGSPVLGAGYLSGSPPRSSSASQLQQPANPLAALNFPGVGSSPPRFGTPSRVSGLSMGLQQTPQPRLSTPPRFNTPPPPACEGSASVQYGSVDSRQPIEDVDVVRRHLVTDDGSDSASAAPTDDEFSSLRLQGGDMHRGIYRYVDGHASNSNLRRARSHSFHVPRPEPYDDTENITSIKAVGGFRRDFIRREHARSPQDPLRRGFLTRNFIEFLTLHGHFAGEDLEEEEEESEEDPLGWAEEGREEPEEETALLGRSRPRSKSISQGTAGTGKAVLLLLKSFVGTGVLFLPKAYSNGGMLFSNLVLLFVAALSYYCFVLLVRTRLKYVGSFGGMFQFIISDDPTH